MRSDSKILPVKGFTLIEMMIAMTVFVLILGVGMSSLGSVLSGTKKHLSIEEVQNYLSSLVKEVRSGRDHPCVLVSFERDSDIFGILHGTVTPSGCDYAGQDKQEYPFDLVLSSITDSAHSDVDARSIEMTPPFGNLIFKDSNGNALQNNEIRLYFTTDGVEVERFISLTSTGLISLSYDEK